MVNCEIEKKSDFGEKRLLKFGILKMALRNVLRRYPELYDIIVYGSYFRNKSIDIALIVGKTDLMLQSKIIKELAVDDANLHQIEFNNAYKNPVWLTLTTEGFSIKENQFLKDLLGMVPMKIYSYNLRQLSQVKKVQFTRALNQTLKRINGVKFGIGVVLVPIKEVSYFEEFFEFWGLKYESKEWTVF